MTKVRLKKHPIRHSGESRNPVTSTNWTPAFAGVTEFSSTLVINAHNSELTQKPATVLEIEHYSDEQITRWDSEDRLDADERKHILDELQRKFLTNDRTKADGLQVQTVADFLAK